MQWILKVIYKCMRYNIIKDIEIFKMLSFINIEYGIVKRSFFRQNCIKTTVLLYANTLKNEIKSFYCAANTRNTSKETMP